MRRRTVALVAVALTSVVVASCGGRGEPERAGQSRVREGQAAAAFTLPSAQGPEVSLEGYRGERSVLLYFSMGPG
jgi:hypothetical protein